MPGPVQVVLSTPGVLARHMEPSEAAQLGVVDFVVDVVTNVVDALVGAAAQFAGDVASLDPVLLQILVFGLLAGGVYALVALGLTMIYGVMDIINVAHGAFMGVGMYTVWYVATNAGVSPFLAIPIAVALTFALGVAIHRSMVEPLIDASASAQVIVLLGVLFILQSGFQIAFGPDPKQVTTGLGSIEVSGIFIPVGELLALGVAGAAVAAMWYLLYHTRLGLAIRGTSDDLESARFRGIDVARVNYVTFGLGAALAGLAGGALATYRTFTPVTGDQFLLYAFIVAVLGGLGSFPGSLVAGLFLGVVYSFGAYYLPGTTSQIFVYVIFVGTLLLRPEGLFGSVVQE